ncbi:MAG: DUF2029 domain-containing protein, partial [Candidatus Eremiobacteraeota bacterium]|nr:DUF2029 domain-containing protein [Candidatus Eremiobacteraeota bacterium]
MRPAALLVFAALLALAAITVARPHSTPGPTMRDFEAYYAAGAARLNGVDPYGPQLWKFEKSIPGVDATRMELLPFVGPPASLPLWSALARLPYPIAAIVWGGVLAVAAAALLWMLLAIFLRASAGAGFAAIVLALGFGPLTSDLALGQIALVAIVGVIGGALCIERRSGAGTFGALAGVTLSAVQPNLAVLNAATAGASLRRWLLIGASGATFAGLCMAVVGPAGLAAYAGHLAAHGRAEQDALIQITPRAVAFGFGASDAAATIVHFAMVVCAIVIWAYAMSAWRGEHWRRRLAFSCAILPFAIPFLHEHDLVIEIFAIFFCLSRVAPERRDPALACALLVAIDWLGLAQRPDAAPQAALLATAFVLAAVWLFPAVRPGSATAGVALLFVACAIFGHVVPAPVWPDALTGHAHVWSDSALW